jgi:hypothetical protein
MDLRGNIHNDIGSEVDFRDHISLNGREIHGVWKILTNEIGTPADTDGEIDFREHINLNDKVIRDVHEVHTDRLTSPDSPNVTLVEGSGLNMKGKTLGKAYKVQTDRLVSWSNNAVEVQDPLTLNNNNIQAVNALGGYNDRLGVMSTLDLRKNPIQRVQEMQIKSTKPQIVMRGEDEDGIGQDGRLKVDNYQLWLGNAAESQGIQIDFGEDMEVWVVKNSEKKRRLYPPHE